MSNPTKPSTEQKPAASGLQIFFVIVSYFTISMSLVFVNKLIMAEFAFPLFMTWFQFVVALILVSIAGSLGATVVPLLSFIPPPEFHVDIAKKVAPVTALFCVMVVFNNLCLQYVEVSFYQVARSLTIGFTIVFSYFLLNKTTSFQAICCCGIVFLGFFTGSYGELRFSARGLFFGVLSSAFVSVYSIAVKRALNVLNNDHWRLLIYNNAMSTVLLFPVVFMFGEFADISNDPRAADPHVWYLNLVGGFLGFAINLAMFLQIKFTSPLTNNICGTTKAALQTVLGVMIWKNPISATSGLGSFLVIVGSGLYSFVRYSEMNSSK